MRMLRLPVLTGALFLSITGANAFEAATEVFSVATCLATTVEALSATATRFSALFVNDSTQTIWLKIAENAVANQGIRLNANGGSYYMSSSTGNLDTEELDCITTSGNGGVLLVTEWAE